VLSGRDNLLTMRFIPARAGNGHPATTNRPTSTVHPRARGERRRRRCGWGSSLGSSPRARGTVRSRSCRPPFLRFIPARAGNGCVVIVGFHPRPVHPRARGERGLELLQGVHS